VLGLFFVEKLRGGEGKRRPIGGPTKNKRNERLRYQNKGEGKRKGIREKDRTSVR